MTMSLRQYYIAYDYTDNVRELENIIKRAILLTKGKQIKLETLPLEILQNKRSITTPRLTVARNYKELRKLRRPPSN